MKYTYVAFVFIVMMSCLKQGGGGNQSDNAAPVSASKDTIVSVKPDTTKIYLTSTYDDTARDLNHHIAILKELCDSAVFSRIHDSLLVTLEKNHLDYFTARPDYQLVYGSSAGDLFGNGKEDNCFVVYDKRHVRVSILVYNALEHTYAELFRDIDVKNGLADAGCNDGDGTLDYQLADELIYQKEYLIEDPLKQIGDTKCKIANIYSDDDFALDAGCFAKGFSTASSNQSLCISTSSVYNNWECLMYDRRKNEFVIFFGQAFAD